MHTAELTDGAAAALDAVLADIEKEGKLPAFFFGVANHSKVLYFNGKGNKVVNDPSQGQVNADTTMQLFSMTKMITSIACLQLAEQGKLDFDDPQIVNKHLPEITTQPILEGFEGDQPITKQRSEPITVRRLLTHTSGLGYGFLDPVTQKYVAQKSGAPPAPLESKSTIESYTLPLRFEPGTHFQYGVGIDWAGILVERLSGMNLDEYFQEYIFHPIGVKGLTFYPTDDIKRDLMQMTGRAPNGQLVAIDGMRPISKMGVNDVGQLGGGGGLLGTLHDYLLVQQEVLKCLHGTGKILKQETAKKMFESALPDRSAAPAVYTDMGRFMELLGNTVEKQNSGEQITHSLAISVNTEASPYGRSAYSGAWGGAARTVFWIDPASGIAVVGGTQIFDENRLTVMEATNKLEQTLYANLKKKAE